MPHSSKVPGPSFRTFRKRLKCRRSMLNRSAMMSKVSPIVCFGCQYNIIVFPTIFVQKICPLTPNGWSCWWASSSCLETSQNWKRWWLPNTKTFCCCFETLTHTQGYELLMTQWQCLVPCCCWGCCIHQWSFQIYIKLPCVGLRKSALRFTKGFKRWTLIFYNFLCG